MLIISGGRYSEPEFAIPAKIDGCPVHMFERLIDMPVRRIAPPVGAAVVLFAAQVGTRAPQQLNDPVEAAAAVEAGVHGRVIFDILSVKHGGPIDFTDCRFHFVVGLDQPARDIRLLLNAQQELSPAQVAAGSKIRGMAALGIECGQGEDQSDQA
jgi:hypothetical protein